MLGVEGATTALAQSAQYQSVRGVRGSITGIVSDDRGGPIAGAHGVGARHARPRQRRRPTRPAGSRSTRCPLGDYTVQAHRTGFAGLRPRHASASAASAVAAAPAAAPARKRRSRPPAPRRWRRARSWRPASGCPGRPSRISPTRRRRRRRGARRSSAHRNRVAAAPHQAQHPQGRRAGRRRSSSRTSEIPARHRRSAARWARPRAWRRRFFTELPFSGEVNLLTTSAFALGRSVRGRLHAARRRLHGDRRPQPAPATWSVRAAMSQGDLSSWIVAGAFEIARTSTHSYRFGLSYSKQEYLGGNPSALAAVTDGSRNVGELYGFDNWTVIPRHRRRIRHPLRHVRLSRSAGGLVSPRRRPCRSSRSSNTRVSAIVAQRMVAPGAEEFVASETPGPWLPPERTFAPLGGLASANPFSVERARFVDLMVEHEFDAPRRHRRAPLLPGRRRSARHALRPEPAGRAALGRPLLRRQRRLAWTRTAGPCA